MGSEGQNGESGRDVDPVRAVHERAREEEFHQFQRSTTTDEDSIAGRRTLQGRKRKSGSGDRRAKERFIDNLILQSIQDRINAIDSLIARLDVEIDYLHADLAFLDTRLGQIATRLAGLARIKRLIEDGEAPALDADGRLSDKAAEEAIHAYEQRTGKTVDRSDLQDLMSAIWLQEDFLAKERAEISAERDEKLRQRDAKLDQRNALQVERERLAEGLEQAERISDPAARQVALEALLDTQQISEAAKEALISSPETRQYYEELAENLDASAPERQESGFRFDFDGEQPGDPPAPPRGPGGP